MNYRKLISVLENKTVWIQTHNYPDPDALACAVGMKEFLSHFGINAKLCHDGTINKLSASKMLTLLNIDISEYSKISEIMCENDAILLVDCQKKTGNTTDMIGDEVAVIDHHPTIEEVEYKYSDIRITGACASIVAEYFKYAGFAPTPLTATALSYGIKMDTMHLRRGTSTFDIEMLAYLFPFADKKILRDLESNNMELSDLRGYAKAIENIKTYGSIGFSYIDFECPDALVGILSDFLLSLAEVDVVVLFAPKNNGYKFSFRSERKDVHAEILAVEGLKGYGSGGGHACMASGFVSFGDKKIIMSELFKKVQEHFLVLINGLISGNIEN